MKRNKIIWICVAICLLACVLVGVLLFGGNEKEKEEVKDTKEAVILPEEPDTAGLEEGMVKSYLTGEPVAEEIGRRRPMAITLNNIEVAVPQAGIANAGVVYEAPVEGGITRLMGIFEDYDDLDKIGSVRSCRDYFIFYALGFDAFYVHYGQAAYSLPYLELENVNNINGMTSYGEEVFYRTTDRKAPHNAYTSFEGLQKGVEVNGYTQEYAADYEGHYQFAEAGESIELNGTPAAYVSPHYMVNNPWFEYNSEEELYYRFQYGGPQIDELTNEQLAYKNIIMQYSQWQFYEDSTYLNIDTQSGGAGKYITNGTAIDITWTKDSEWGVTHYFDAAGNEIKLNTGKTWVCIIEDTSADQVEITGGDTQVTE